MSKQYEIKSKITYNTGLFIFTRYKTLVNNNSVGYSTDWRQALTKF